MPGVRSRDKLERSPVGSAWDGEEPDIEREEILRSRPAGEGDERSVRESDIELRAARDDFGRELRSADSLLTHLIGSRARRC
jgi:hypothetical protein